MSPSQSLELRSLPLRVEPGSALKPYAETRGPWTVSEQVAWSDDIVGHAYHVSIRAVVFDGDDPGVVFMRACDIARDLDRAFTYATGWPLGNKSFKYLFSPQSAPRAWTLAAGKELISESDWEILGGVASRPRSRMLPREPLRSTLRVLDAIGNADATVAELSQLHYGALSTHDPSLAPLLLSKGLETARELLPGSDLKAKGRYLPSAIASQLAHDLSWFYDISNNRRETRHLVDKGASLVLKDELSENERDDFLNGADLLLHHTVVSQLNLPLVLMDSAGVSRVAS